MICECKAAIPDSAKSCPKCGKEFTKLAVSSAPTSRKRRPILPALIGGVAALIFAVGLGLFYFGGRNQSFPPVNAPYAAKGLIDTGLTESKQSATVPATQAEAESGVEIESQPAITARAGLADASPSLLPESKASSEPKPPLFSEPVTAPSPVPAESSPRSESQRGPDGPSDPANSPPKSISESRVPAEPHPPVDTNNVGSSVPETQSAPAEVSDSTSQPSTDSRAALEPQPPPEASKTVADTDPPQPVAEPRQVDEPPQVGESLPAQPAPDGRLPDVDPASQASPPAATSTPAKPKTPATAKRRKPEPPGITSAELNSALRQHGLGDVRAKVIDKQTVALTGTVRSAEEKRAAGHVVTFVSGIRNIRNGLKVAAGDPAPVDSPKPLDQEKQDRGPEDVAIANPDAAPDPARLEGEINRALREAGVGGVTAQIGDDLSATLRGATRSVDEKDTAFQIARRFQVLSAVKDQIFVIEE